MRLRSSEECLLCLPPATVLGPETSRLGEPALAAEPELRFVRSKAPLQVAPRQPVALEPAACSAACAPCLRARSAGPPGREPFAPTPRSVRPDPVRSSAGSKEEYRTP